MNLYRTVTCNQCESTVSYYVYSKTTVVCVCGRVLGKPSGHKLKLVQ